MIMFFEMLKISTFYIIIYIEFNQITKNFYATFATKR